ncbi:alpha/beta fold hydrolase [Kitasatospora sp. NPDC057692]|uniref:alpha/beta fold hydrolase n=1 Tax=Kitasatospora sp. NPDC057692 TaxID=3346215 RepID=UPI00367B0975
MSARPATDPAPSPAATALGAFLAAYDEALARWPLPVEALTVPTPYGATRVNACGPRDGRPLVLLPGGGATATCWSANAAALAGAGHRVLAVDLLGDPGRSTLDRPRLGGVPELLGWLDAVLDGLEVPAADLAGHSYGGWTALRYALYAPARIRRLALLDPTGCFTGFRARYLLRALPLLLPPRTAAKARSYLDWESRGGAGPDPAWRELYALGLAGFPAARPVTGPRPSAAELGALTAPVLVLLAGLSRTHDARTVAALARRALPHAAVTVLPDVSHHTLLTARPDEVNRHLTAFLAPDPADGG